MPVLVDTFPDGVVFVDLAPLRDVQLVPATIVRSLAVHGPVGRDARERLLDHLGLSPAFSGIIDIVAADFEPKPALAGYRLLLQRHTVRPETALMVEDIARNLAPAAELGMTTAWMRNDLDWAKSDKDSAFIHYIVDDLAGFLAAAADLQSGDRRETR